MNICHAFIVYRGLKQDQCKLQIDPEDAELFSSMSLLLDRSYKYLFKTPFFVSSFLAYSSFVYSKSEEFASDSLSNG